MNSNQEINTFTTIALENALKIYKSQLYHEIHVDNLKELEADIKNAKNNKEKADIKRAIVEAIKKNKKNQERIEKYNSEATNAFNKFNSDKITEFLKDFTTDFYSDVTKLILKACPNKGDNFVVPAVLKEQKGGGLFLNGKEFKIFTL